MYIRLQNCPLDLNKDIIYAVKVSLDQYRRGRVLAQPATFKVHLPYYDTTVTLTALAHRCVYSLIIVSVMSPRASNRTQKNNRIVLHRQHREVGSWQAAAPFPSCNCFFLAHGSLNSWDMLHHQLVYVSYINQYTFWLWSRCFHYREWYVIVAKKEESLKTCNDFQWKHIRIYGKIYTSVLSLKWWSIILTNVALIFR